VRVSKGDKLDTAAPKSNKIFLTATTTLQASNCNRIKMNGLLLFSRFYFDLMVVYNERQNSLSKDLILTLRAQL
jgi:hypothetical protein